jgi:hypothetical protein
MLNVVSNENYAALLNAIMQQLGYPIPQKEQEEDTQKKAKSRAPQKKSSPERGSGLNLSPTTAAAVEPDSPTKKKLEQLQRLAAQSRPGPEKSKGKVR